MGSRKHNKAEETKDAKKTLYYARLNDNPTSPRKARLVADIVRGVDVERALHVLKTAPQEAAEKIYKLLRSAIANWEKKNEGKRLEESGLYVKEIFVDGGRMLKRLRTAPQGRGYRIKKRSNHITIILGSRLDVVQETEKNNE